MLGVVACVPVLAAAACGPDAAAPVPIGFTGRCKLEVPPESGSITHHFLTPDDLKTHIVLDVVKDTLVNIHVEIPDTRQSSSLEQLPDNPLAEGNAKPDVVLDREGDVDVPMVLQSRAGGEPWELPVRVRFRGDSAEVVAGRMIARGPCVRPPPTE